MADPGAVAGPVEPVLQCRVGGRDPGDYLGCVHRGLQATDSDVRTGFRSQGHQCLWRIDRQCA